MRILEKIVSNYAAMHIYLRDRLESVFLSVSPDSICQCLCLLDEISKIIKNAKHRVQSGPIDRETSSG